MSTSALDPVSTLRDLLDNTETYATVLMAIVLSEYGTEALEWAPETLFMELVDDFKTNLPRLNKDKLVIGFTLLTSDDFYRRVSRFIQICNVLSGSAMSTDFDKADAMECAWGITEALLLSPPEEDEEEPFSEEIRHYIGQILDSEGIQNPPDVLRLAISDRQQSSNDLEETIPTDDPMMFAQAYGVRADRNAQITEMLHENIRELLDQLELLPAVQSGGGNTLQRMRKALRG